MLHNISSVAVALEQATAQQITELDNGYVLFQYLATQDSISKFLFTVVETLHVDNAHAYECHNKACLAAMCRPFLPESQHFLPLIIVLINKREILKGKMSNLRTREIIVVHVAKFVLEGASIEDRGYLS
jgi:hypothetical protein